jgi:Ca-activated chloride channel homolog
MEWQHPQWLYLILPLAAAWLALALYSRRRRRRAAAAFVAQSMWSRILPADSRTRFGTKLVLRELALVTGLIALAGPRFGTQSEVVVPRGSDLYVLIDVSRSMLAEDVPPSRLGRAKSDVAALVNRLDGERVGLIAFAGQAVVKCPLTVDYDAFRRSLDELDPSSAPRGGTAIGDAIRKALEVFQPRADRDHAILLITDGDDQQSYPLEAAAIAAERHVTIFTVGLGDANQGARIPQSARDKSYLEYEGHQVWSKLDGSLLKEIALKTSGVYVPVETRAYDLGELYAKYLHGRRGGEGQARKRIRRADQFQLFLALALLALLADAFIRPYRDATKSSSDDALVLDRRSPGAPNGMARKSTVGVSGSLVLIVGLASVSRADDATDTVRDGLRLYNSGEFEKARDKFATARVQFGDKDAAKAAIAAFDEACAAHRKGDVAQARESYLKAGLAHDKRLAASAHFNLGTLAAEEARKSAGEKPEDVPPEKRQ